MTSHVIIGGGPAATNAAETIRQFNDGDSITLVCDEPAHSRMALPYWLAGNIPREHTHTGDDAYFQRLNVATRFGVRVQSIDASGKSVALSDGSELAYDKLLIATGSSPAPLPIPGTDLPGVQHMWSLEHTERLLASADGIEQPRVAMIGAGFIGFIVLNAMFKRGWSLSVIEREGQVLPRMLDAGAAGLVQNWLQRQGVGVQVGATVQEIVAGDGGAKRLRLDNGSEVEADLVIVATGIQPNIQLADSAGLDTDHAILVNNRLETSVADIYAAGDVAQGPVLFSDQSEVHAIQPTAVDHGRVAGANMTGAGIEYPGSLLMNVVDVCGLQTASFGAWNDADAETITICNEAGSVYRKLLLRDDLLVGAIFAGRPNDLGMLTDVGMVKGMLQTQTRLGSWKAHLQQHPFDIRRVYVGTGVAAKLAATTLLGRPTQSRDFHFGGAKPSTPENPSHKVYVGTKSS